MRTDKPNTTASATPDKVREEWRHPITGETRAEMHAKRTKVTPQVEALDGMTPLGIPAEKPTDALKEIGRTLHVTLCKLDKAQAHAAQLAEALREIASDFESRKTYRPDNQIDSALNTLRQNARIAKQALAAYDNER